VKRTSMALALSLMTTTALATQQKPIDLEVNLNLALSGSEVTSIEECTEKLETIKTTLDELNINLQRTGESISFKDTDNVVNQICTNIKASHEERLAQEQAMKDLLIATGDKDKANKLTYFSTKDGEEKVWTYDVKLGGSILSGNDNFTLVETEGTATGNFATHSLKITTKGQYKKTDETSYSKIGISVNDSIQIDKLTGLSEQWGAFWDVAYSRDDAKGVDGSLDIIAGAGYNFLDKYSGAKDKLKLSIALGHRSRNNSDGTSNDNPLVSTRVQFVKGVTDTVTLKAYLSHVANLDDVRDDYEVKGSAGVDIKINEKSSFGIVLEKTYDNTPVSGREKSDSILKVEYKHKF